MKGKMKVYVHYDHEADFLEICVGDIKKGEFENLGDGVFQIIHEETGEVMGAAIHSFKKQKSRLGEIKLKVPFEVNILN